MFMMVHLAAIDHESERQRLQASSRNKSAAVQAPQAGQGSLVYFTSFPSFSLQANCPNLS